MMRPSSMIPRGARRFILMLFGTLSWAITIHAQNRPNPTATTSIGGMPVPGGIAAPVLGRADSGTGQGATPSLSPTATINAAPAIGSLLVYKREVFAYAKAGLRDPVSPPSELVRRDRFPALTLAGILYDDGAPEKSTAILVIRRVTPDGRLVDGKAERKMVHIGDRVNAFRVIQINPKNMVVDKEILGTVERITLKKATRKEAAEAPSRAAVDITLEPPPVRPRRPTGVIRNATPAPRDSLGARLSPKGQSLP